MDAVFERNLRHQVRLLGALSLGLAVAELLFIQVAAALDSGPGFGNIVRMMPRSVQSMFGEQLALASFNAASAFGFQHPAVVMAACAFIIVACTIPAGERESGILELVLARPVSRSRYLWGALALALVGVVVLPSALLAAVGIGLGTVNMPNELPWHRYTMSAVGLAALLSAFTGITLLLSATARRRGPAVAHSVGLILALYLLDVFGERLAWLEWLRWASPFRYFRPIRSAVFGETQVEHLALLVLVGAVTSAVAFWWFNRGDATGGRW